MLRSTAKRRSNRTRQQQLSDPLNFSCGWCKFNNPVLVSLNDNFVVLFEDI